MTKANEHTVWCSDWLPRLDEALFPPYYRLGSLQDLSPDLIPELDEGLQVVKSWVKELVYKLDPYEPPNLFLTSLIRVARLAFTFDRKGAHNYLHRAPCVISYRPPPLLRGPDKAYVVHDILLSMQNDHISAFNQGILFLK